MSARNGDKARHHRLRKQKIARRLIMASVRKAMVTPAAAPEAAAAKSE